MPITFPTNMPQVRVKHVAHFHDNVENEDFKIISPRAMTWSEADQWARNYGLTHSDYLYVEAL